MHRFDPPFKSAPMAATGAHAQLSDKAKQLETAIESAQAVVSIRAQIVEYVIKRLSTGNAIILDTALWPDLLQAELQLIQSQQQLSQQDLDRAELRLRDAEQRLRDAKQEIDRAEHRLRDAKQGIDPWLGATTAFCGAIQRARETAGSAAVRIVEVDDPFHWLVEKCRVLYERVEVVDALWEKLQQLGNFESLVVCGNAGIGKSVGLINAMLRRLLQRTRDPDEYVVVVTGDEVHIFDHNGLHAQMELPVVKASGCLQRAKCVWLLHDIKSNSQYDHNIWRSVSTVVRLVLFSSPQENNYRTAVQHIKYDSLFYVPTWSFPDLKVMIPAATQDAFDDVGGIPRHIHRVGGAAISSCLAVR
jgi:tRNA U34 5-carboxymethylaminomethyl modifying GTPase MnmE/TrmE